MVFSVPRRAGDSTWGVLAVAAGPGSPKPGTRLSPLPLVPECARRLHYSQVAVWLSRWRLGVSRACVKQDDVATLCWRAATVPSMRYTGRCIWYNRCGRVGEAQKSLVSCVGRLNNVTL
jgi:hypothetical protein